MSANLGKYPTYPIVHAHQTIVRTDQLKVKREIGRGSLGIIYEGCLGGKKVAVKVIDIHSQNSEPPYLMDLDPYHNIQQANIVTFYGACFDSEKLLIITELMHMSLLNFLKEFKQTPIDPHFRLCIAQDLAKGLQYMHACGVTHRDVRASKIFIDTSGHAKLGGMKLLVCSASKYKYNSECISKMMNIGKKEDVYGLTVIFLQLHTRTSPFPGQDNIFEMLEKGITPVMPAEADQEWAFAPIIRKSFTVSGENRPSATQIVSMLAQIK